MSDIKVGMRLKPVLGDYPEIIVTELTPKGFRYMHEPVRISPRIGVTEGGEHFGYDGEALYEPVEPPDNLARRIRLMSRLTEVMLAFFFPIALVIVVLMIVTVIWGKP
jgi:hypothetical protein